MVKNKRGFTLIEILVVLTIIGILVGLSLTAFYGSRKASRDGERKTDLEQIRSALEMYRADQSPPNYPASLASLDPNYISAIPVDPLSPSREYYYSGLPNTYTLCAALETGGVAGSCGAASCGPGITCDYKVKQP